MKAELILELMEFYIPTVGVTDCTNLFTFWKNVHCFSQHTRLAKKLINSPTNFWNLSCAVNVNCDMKWFWDTWFRDLGYCPKEFAALLLQTAVESSGLKFSALKSNEKMYSVKLMVQWWALYSEFVYQIIIQHYTTEFHFSFEDTNQMKAS